MFEDSRTTFPAPYPPRTLSRREFARRLAEAAAGAGLLSTAFAGCRLTPPQRAETAEAIVGQIGNLPKRLLGRRMGAMKIAPILISQDWSPDLYAPGLAAGLNFVHKAGYWQEMPDEFKKIPRESYYTDITVDSTPNHPDDEGAAYRQVTDSLSRNGLKYYDIFRAHYGWKSVDEMKNQRGTRRAFERLHKEGKVRYYGVSQHDWVSYPEIIQALIDDGQVDSIQCFFSYGTPPDVQAIFEKAHQAGIGMTAMKVYQNGSDGMQQDAARQKALKATGMIGRACIRHVLTLGGSDGKPIFDACVSNLRNFSQFEENVGAVASKVARADGFHDFSV